MLYEISQLEWLNICRDFTVIVPRGSYPDFLRRRRHACLISDDQNFQCDMSNLKKPPSGRTKCIEGLFSDEDRSRQSKRFRYNNPFQLGWPETMIFNSVSNTTYPLNCSMLPATYSFTIMKLQNGSSVIAPKFWMNIPCGRLQLQYRRTATIILSTTRQNHLTINQIPLPVRRGAANTHYKRWVISRYKPLFRTLR